MCACVCVWGGGVLVCVCAKICVYLCVHTHMCVLLGASGSMKFFIGCGLLLELLTLNTLRIMYFLIVGSQNTCFCIIAMDK